jgi:hypothetical protein
MSDVATFFVELKQLREGAQDLANLHKDMCESFLSKDSMDTCLARATKQFDLFQSCRKKLDDLLAQGLLKPGAQLQAIESFLTEYEPLVTQLKEGMQLMNAMRAGVDDEVVKEGYVEHKFFDNVDKTISDFQKDLLTVTMSLEDAQVLERIQKKKGIVTTLQSQLDDIRKHIVEYKKNNGKAHDHVFTLENFVETSTSKLVSVHVLLDELVLLLSVRNTVSNLERLKLLVEKLAGLVNQ